jgi:hypothetical protein
MTQDAESYEDNADGLSVASDLSVQAEENFMKIFKVLCKGPEDVAQMKRMQQQILDRWGWHGLDLVSVFWDKYYNLDFARLKTAVEVFVSGPSMDIQRAIEEFWWLMGLAGYDKLLADPRRFEVFSRLMAEKGLEVCKMRAAEIQRRINDVTGQPE